MELNLQVLSEKIVFDVETSNWQVMALQKAMGKPHLTEWGFLIFFNYSSPLIPKSSLSMSNCFTIVIKKSLFLLSKVHSLVLQAEWLPTFTLHSLPPQEFCSWLFSTHHHQDIPEEHMWSGALSFAHISVTEAFQAMAGWGKKFSFEAQGHDYSCWFVHITIDHSKSHLPHQGSS